MYHNEAMLELGDLLICQPYALIHTTMSTSIDPDKEPVFAEVSPPIASEVEELPPLISPAALVSKETLALPRLT